jgi:hypothetical protein
MRQLRTSCTPFGSGPNPAQSRAYGKLIRSILARSHVTEGDLMLCPRFGSGPKQPTLTSYRAPGLGRVPNRPHRARGLGRVPNSPH